MKQFPWAYIMPSRGYVKLIRIERSCPEIRHIVHERARQRAIILGKSILWLPVLVPLFILALVANVVESLTEWVLDRWQSPLAPHIRRNRDLVYEAHAILSPADIRERLEGRDRLFF